MRSLTQRWAQSGHFLLFLKRAGEASHSSLVACQWVWLNKHQYPWISLKVLENTWINCCDSVSTLNMHDHLTYLTGFDASGSKCAKVLNMARLYMQGLCKVLNMSEYGSIVLNNASICLSVSQFAWTWLNIVKCPWICLKMLK